MKLFSKKKPLTRREVVSQRRLHIEKKQADSIAGSPSYRRSRTLGAKRAGKKQDSKSERQIVWEIKKQRRKFGAILGVVVVAGLGVIGLLLQLTVNIKVETPDMQSQASADKYIDILDDYYAKRPIERLRFMLDESSLYAYFIDRAPEVKNIRIVGSSQLATSSAQITFRKPTVEWSAVEKTYYVDDTGVTFEKSYFDSPGIVVSDQSGVSPQAGQEVINRRFLSFLGQAVSLLGEANLPASEVILPPNTVRQVEFRLEGKSYLVKMTVDRDVKAQVQQVPYAVKFIDERGLAPEYIDVRVNQQVFYK